MDSVTFELTHSDAAKCGEILSSREERSRKSYIRAKWKHRIVAWSLLALGLALFWLPFLMFVIVAEGHQVLWISYLCIVAFFSGPVLAYFYKVPLQNRALWSAYCLRGERTCTINEEGVVYESKVGKCFTYWEYIEGIEVINGLLLIYFDKNTALYIPTKSFLDNDSLNRFILKANQYRNDSSKYRIN